MSITQKLAPRHIRKWALKGTTRVATFNAFAVDKHGVEAANGRKGHDVFTFACPDWSNVVAITPEREIVLVWQYRYGTDALSLEIPGGVIDAGETPMEAAKRELLEETGFSADRFEPLVVVEPNPALQGNKCHTFLAHNAKLVQAPSFDENEELEVVLATEAEVLAALDAGMITHALVHSALEVFLRKASSPARGRG